jgi:hypothetical protein
MQAMDRQSDSAVPAHGESDELRRSSLFAWVTCAVAVLLFVFAAARFFFGPTFGLLLNSDVAVPALLAAEIWRKASVFPESWYYANGEIWTLSPQILALPFVATLGLSSLALKLGNIVCLALTAGSMILLIHRVTKSLPFAITVAVGVLAVFSRLHVDMVYEQAAYGWICAQLTALIYFSLLILSDQRKDSSLTRFRIRWSAVFYVLLLAQITVGSPLRAAVYWCVPIVVVCFLLPPEWSRRQAVLLLALTCGALFVGMAGHGALGRDLLIAPGVGSFALQPPSRWATNLSVLWRGVPMLLEFAPMGSFKAIDPASAAEIMRCLFFASAGATTILVWRSGPAECAEARFFAQLAAVMLGVVTAVLLIGNLVVNELAVRYLLPQTVICLAAFMTVLWYKLGARSKRLRAVSALFVLAFCGGAALLPVTLRSGPPSTNCDAPAGICDLQSTLLQHDLHMGYATYWNANVTTLASRGEIVVCGILLRPRVAPMRWLVSKDCFDAPQRTDRYFIAFTRAEVAKLDRHALIADTGNPDATASAGDYEIWIYEAANHSTEWLRR